MILQREGREVDEMTYVKTSESMLRMQRIADRLVSITPEISKFLPTDSMLRTTKIQAIQTRSDVIGGGINPRTMQKLRETTTGLPAMKAEMSSEDVRQRAMNIESILEDQKTENEKLKTDLESKKDRYVVRELEYRKIIDELQNEIRQNAVLDVNEAKLMEGTTKAHAEIQDRIGRLQVKTSHVLVDQEKTVIKFFNDKIAEIKKQFEEERIKKGKKDQDYIQRENQLISELEWIENIAQKIENQNINLEKKLMDLNAQYQTQESDRIMLNNELTIKKKQNEILRNQIQVYEKMLSQVQEEEIDQDQQSNQYEGSVRKNSATPSANGGLNAAQSPVQIRQSPAQQSRFEYENADNISQTSSKKQLQNISGSSNLRIRTTTKSTNWVMKKYGPAAGLAQSAVSNFGSGSSALKDQKAMHGSKSQSHLNSVQSLAASVVQMNTPLQMNERKIKDIQLALKQEQKRVREIKQLYVKEMTEKSELEKIIRKAVEDIKEDIIQLKGETRVVMQTAESQVQREKRESIIDKLINNEKILTLIYDKTFYPDQKNIQQP